MTENIIIAGSGGQGIMLLGKVLAEAAILEEKLVTYLPAYGPEVRGGTSYCMVIISDQEIGSPYINRADTLIILNNPSLEKFKTRLKSGGLLILNASLAGINQAKAVVCCRFPFTDIALNLGNIKVANMVALGSYLAAKKTLKPSTILQVFKTMVPSDKTGLLQVNQKALEEGLRLKNG